MEIKLNFEEMRKNVRLMVAAPCYGGVCSGVFMKSLLDLTRETTARGIDMRGYYLFNESLIPRARNYCVDVFMQSDCTHLLFIDSDIGFNAIDVIAMLALQTDDSPYDVLAAAYPKKTIAWEKVKLAVQRGIADEDPEKLKDFIGDYVFNPAPGVEEIKITEPAEVSETGTGFMMIRRSTLDKFKAAYPQYSYLPDHPRSESFDGSREIMMYFQSEIDPKSRRYLSEDYWFCQKIREIDLKVWLCPWIQLKHIGSFEYGGSLAALAYIGANPTVDKALLKKGNRKERRATDAAKRRI